MKRSTKIWLCFITILLGMIIISGTMYLAHKNIKSNNISNMENKKLNGGENKQDGGNIPSMQNPPSGIEITNENAIKLTFWYKFALGVGSIIFTFGLVYFALSLFGTRNIFATRDKITIYLLLCFIFGSVITYGTIYLTNGYVLNYDQEGYILKDNNVTS